MSKLSYFCVFLLLAPFCAIGEQPMPRRFPSMSLNNWQDTMITWSGPRDNPNQVPFRNLGVTSFRKSPNWSNSAISSDSFALKINGQIYGQPMLWDGDAMLSWTNTGVFVNQIENYNGENLPFQMNRTYYMPPHQPFYIVEYVFSSPSSATKNYSVEVMDFITTEAGQGLNSGSISNDQNGNSVFQVTNNSTLGLLIGMIGTGTVLGESVGNSSGSTSPLSQYQSTGSLNGVKEYEGNEGVSYGVTVGLTIAPGTTVSVGFVRILQSTSEEALQLWKSTVSGTTPVEWRETTTTNYQKWLSSGKTPSSTDPRTLQFYENSLVLMKNALNPQLGTFVASFHPAYGYKVWSRDCLFAAMIFMESGFLNEGKSIVQWFSQATLTQGGYYHTCYDWYTGNPVGFVEPQLDHLGSYLMAVYNYFIHSKNDYGFLSSIYPRIALVEDFLLKNSLKGGLVPPDYSIWEESSDGHTGKPLAPSYFTFTQSVSYSGLQAAAIIEVIVNNPLQSTALLCRACQLKAAIHSHLFDQNDKVYYRGLNSQSDILDMRADSSTTAVIYLGVTDTVVAAKSHLHFITGNLTQPTGGIARYWGDIFFYQSKFNPGGQEVSGPNPPWGVTTCFTAWAEMTLNHTSPVQNRLTWMLNRAAPGLMAVGEAVDGGSNQFVMSSTPDLYEDAGVYIWTLLMNEGKANVPNPITWQPSFTALLGSSDCSHCPKLP